MRVKNKILLAFLFAASVLSGCCTEKELESGEPFLCYLNLEGTGIEKQFYEWNGESTEEKIQNILDGLCKSDKDGKLRSVIPESVEVQGFVIENTKLDLYFTKEYRKQDDAQEVLCRAAVVQSLTQLDEVSLVKFYVENEPLHNKQGLEIGYMSADDFVQNTGESLESFQKAEFSLWVPDKEGKSLMNEVRTIRYNSNILVEKVIIEQLMTKKAMPNELVVMPPETKLLGVTVKDGICYVNFDEGFQISGYTINPEISIYSIVNSILENSTASQVQISVDGKTDVKFQNVVDLSKPLSINEELMEDK